MNASLVPLLSFVLMSLAVGGALVAAFYPRIAGGSALDKRREAIALAGNHVGTSRTATRSTRKRSVEETLREAAEKQAATRSQKVTLQVRLRQAGLSCTNTSYYAISFGIAGAVALLSKFAIGTGPVAAVGFGISAGLLGPHKFVSYKRNKRLKTFTREFPTATDLIVRGIKSGLPVVDCFKIAAAEAHEPVRGEFRQIVEDQTLGLPVDQAVERMADRIPLPAARFFAIVIAIQSRTGGNLSEALGNLSKVLRERKKMEEKVRAVSSEAKATALIIGCIPVGVAGILYLTAPDYISLLFTTTMGNVVLAASGFWMLIGVLVMRKMINFDM